MESKSSKIAVAVIAFFAGAAIAAIVVFLVTGNPRLMGNNANSMNQTQNENAAVQESGKYQVDISKDFPSWNENSSSLQQLIAFVDDATNPSSSKYVEPEDRVATFDMDGTLICEKAPVYVDFCMMLNRVLYDKSFTPTPEELESAKIIQRHAFVDGEAYSPKEVMTKEELVARAFKGMTTKEFRDYTSKFADETKVVGFSGMTYAKSFYKPMVEVVEFLRKNNFDVWIVSASERNLCRALVEKIGFPYDHVIATDLSYVATNQGDKKAFDYTMTRDENLLLSTPIGDENAKTGKCISIEREIGKRPILSFGNSTGDYAMLDYAKADAEHTGNSFLIINDDETREYGSVKKANDFKAECEKNRWGSFSMANDWKTIYGEGVQKTGLPGESALYESNQESSSVDNSTMQNAA